MSRNVRLDRICSIHERYENACSNIIVGKQQKKQLAKQDNDIKMDLRKTVCD
jgi:hypothetical protein